MLTDAGSRLYDNVKAVATDMRKELLANVDPKHLAVTTALLETLQGLIADAVTKSFNRA